MKNKKILLVVIISVYLVIVFMTLKDSPSQIPSLANSQYKQFKEYQHDLKGALQETDKQKKLENTLRAYTKLNEAKNGLEYLSLILKQEDIDLDYINERVIVIRSNLSNYINYLAVDKISTENIEDVERDLLIAKIISEELSFDNVLSGEEDYEVLRKKIDELIKKLEG